MALVKTVKISLGDGNFAIIRQDDYDAQSMTLAAEAAADARAAEAEIEADATAAITADGLKSISDSAFKIALRQLTIADLHTVLDELQADYNPNFGVRRLRQILDEQRARLLGRYTPDALDETLGDEPPS